MHWDLVAISVANNIQQQFIEEDIEFLKLSKFPSCNELIVVRDPCNDVGSGGSALNALIVSVERLCSKRGYTVLSDDVLTNANVLIVLVGTLSAIQTQIHPKSELIDGGTCVFKNNLTTAIYNANRIAERASDKGIWIIGTDSQWDLRRPIPSYHMPQNTITAFSFESDQVDTDFGVYKTYGHRVIGLEYFEKASSNKLSKTIVLGFVYLPHSIASVFLSFHNTHPICDSTYYGIDSGARGLKLSLFFDFIQATCTERHIFMANRTGSNGNKIENRHDEELTLSRKLIFDKFSEYHTDLEILDIVNYKYKKFGHIKRNFQQLRSSAMTKLSSIYLNPHLNADIEPSLRCEIATRKMMEKRGYGPTTNYMGPLRITIGKAQEEDYKCMCALLFTMSLGLSLEANGEGGLRSGPAANLEFKGRLERLREEGKEISDKELILDIVDTVTREWMNEPSKMIRASRHLEAAAQTLIMKMVQRICYDKLLRITSRNNISPDIVTVTAPARIDWIGGWLDTPPIFFDLAHCSVINMAVKIDGENPISCEIEKHIHPQLVIHQDDQVIRLREIEDVVELSKQPTRVGSLVCACVCALGYSNSTLDKFFRDLRCVGLCVKLTSKLPHGSGLGTSSIMASAVLRALAEMAEPTQSEISTIEERLVHTVLKVEQIMTTGGGWQDQVGAVYPGLKKGSIELNNIGIPRVVSYPIEMSKEFEETINKRLVLVYTGRTRLAKNILQEVIRNWYKGDETQERLKRMAQNVILFEERLRQEKVTSMLLRNYHETKSYLTSGYEPPLVGSLLKKLEKNNIISAGWLAGAGGGGFCYMWLRKNIEFEDIQKFIKSYPEFEQMTCHKIQVSFDTFNVEGSEWEEPPKKYIP